MTSLRPHLDIFPKKYLGQHFLTDHRVVNRIIESCQLGPTDIVLEIGPGLGALTEHIAGRVSHLYAIEKDAQLCQELEQNLKVGNPTVIHGDILKYNLSSLAATKVIGNLPYYISSPIIEKILVSRPPPADIFITVQLEFGQRLAAKPHTRDYSALTCFVQYYADARILFKISNSAFSPSPKVHSCFVHLKTREPRQKAQNTELLFRVIRRAFQQRRKKIGNALTTLLEKDRLQDVLARAGINGELRPENIGLEGYVTLANMIEDLGNKEEGKT